MSRYDKYAESARAVLRSMSELVRKQGRASCSAQDFCLALLQSGLPEIRQLLAKAQVAEERLKDLCLAQEQTGTGTAPQRLALEDDLRRILDQAEAMAKDKPVGLRELLCAAEAQLSQLLANLGAAQKVAVSEWIGQLEAEQPATQTAASLEALPKLSRELTAEQRPFPVVGRERELSQLISVLTKFFKPNALLIGEPGVGKTALVEGLAQRIRQGDVPAPLKGARIFEVKVGDLVAGTGVVGTLEDRVRKMLNELESLSKAILFLDEIHQIVRSHTPSALADLFKPALARGKFRCIGATTIGEYHRYIEQDEALARRFETIVIQEPTNEETLEILRGLQKPLEAHYKLTITAEALSACVALSSLYIPNRRFPDKAIDALDRACVLAVQERRNSLSAATVETAVAERAGLALHLNRDEYNRRLEQLGALLSSRVFGQQKAIESVANVVTLCKRRLDLHPERPDGVFLFVGPRGTGKRTLGRSLAQILTGREDACIELDMSEYKSDASLTSLIGSPPGYVGYDDQPRLARALRGSWSGVLLLRQFQLACEPVQKFFSEVFQSGRLELANGKSLFLSNMTIIATLDLQADALARLRRSPGFHLENTEPSAEQTLTELSRWIPSEALRSFDEVVFFQPLDSAARKKIVSEILLPSINHRLRQQFAIELAVDETVLDWLAAPERNPEGGAHQLEQVLMEHVLARLPALSFSTPGLSAPPQLCRVRLCSGQPAIELPGAS